MSGSAEVDRVKEMWFNMATAKAWRFCLLGTTAPQLNINCGQSPARVKRHALAGNDAARERDFVIKDGGA